MDIKWIYTDQGDGEDNEDVVGYEKNTAWVIDGASEVFDEHYFSQKNDVLWLVERLNKKLSRYVDDKLSLEEILKLSVGSIRRELTEEGIELSKIEEYKLPSFTIAMVRKKKNRIEYYILGDCSIVINVENYVKSYTDQRIKKFSTINKTKFNEINNSQKYSKRKEIQIYRDTRKYMNKIDGYWIGSIDGKGISNGISGTIIFNKSIQILCFTDGLLEAFESLNIAKYNQEIFDEKKLKDIIEKLRNMQNADRNRIKNPRVKIKDDLSLILLEGCEEDE